MNDREQVISNLKKSIKYHGHLKDTFCKECIQSMNMAIAMLEEAVEPKKIKGYNPPSYTLYQYKCEKCESPVVYKQPFCMGCGRPVKWE